MSNKIAFIDPTGRTPHYVLPIIDAINQTGVYQAYYYTSKNSRIEDYKLYSNKINYYFGNYSNRYIFSIKYIIAMFRLAFNDTNILHLQWLPFPIIYFPLIRLYKLMNKKVYFTIHNIYPHDCKKMYIKYIYNRLYKIFDGYIVHNHYQLSYLVGNNMIDEKDICVISHPLLTYQKYYINDEVLTDKYFLFIGNIKRYKGLDFLFQSISSLSDFQFIVAGKKNYQIDINNMKNLKIINKFLDEYEFTKLVQNCKALLLPYKEINQSGILYLAITMDIPVIISRLKPFVEILGDNYPFYFDVTCINDFVDTVKKFSKRDSEEISEYKSIYKKIRSQLTDEKLSSQYLNFYQKNN